MSKISNTNLEKTVLVTGATGGLGNAFVYEFCKMGYNLFLTGTNDVKLQNLKQELLKQFPSLNILTKSCDLSSLESRKEFTEYLIANNIQIRFLVNNAGFITEGKIKYASLDTLLKAIQVNCEGVVHLTKSVLDNKKPQDKLNIICGSFYMISKLI